MAKIVLLPERKAKKDVPHPEERFVYVHEYYAMRRWESQEDRGAGSHDCVRAELVCLAYLLLRHGCSVCTSVARRALLTDGFIMAASARTIRQAQNTNTAGSTPRLCINTPVSAIPNDGEPDAIRRKTLLTRPCSSSGICASR